MTTLIKFIIGLLTVALFTSCSWDIGLGQVQGNGNVQTEDFNISEKFSEVTASKGWEVYLEKGNSNSVIVEADENLIDIAKIYVTDGNLRISSDKNIGSASSKKVFVTYSDDLEELRVSSGAHLTTKEALRGENISFDISSGGILRAEATAREVHTDVSSGGVAYVKGNTERHIISASSGGVIKAKDMKASYANADVSSGGVIGLHVSDHLEADASSGGIINYSGNPKEIDKPAKNYSGGVIKADR